MKTYILFQLPLKFQLCAFLSVSSLLCPKLDNVIIRQTEVFSFNNTAHWQQIVNRMINSNTFYYINIWKRKTGRFKCLSRDAYNRTSNRVRLRVWLLSLRFQSRPLLCQTVSKQTLAIKPLEIKNCTKISTN